MGPYFAGNCWHICNQSESCLELSFMLRVYLFMYLSICGRAWHIMIITSSNALWTLVSRSKGNLTKRRAVSASPFACHVTQRTLRLGEQYLPGPRFRRRQLRAPRRRKAKPPPPPLPLLLPPQRPPLLLSPPQRMRQRPLLPPPLPSWRS